MQESKQKPGQGQGPRTQGEGDDRLPWSYRLSASKRLLVCLLSAVLVGAIGTAVHRMGAALNIPYGMVLSLVLVGLSAWSARARSGFGGLLLHFVVSCAVAWGFALIVKPQSALVATGSPAFTTYFSTEVWKYWLFGIIAAQVLIAFLPSRAFLPASREQASS